MKVVLIKWKPKYDDIEEIVGIAANEEVAYKHMQELALKYPHCYGATYGTRYFEDFDLIEE
jgi:hypothetical protein